MLRILIEVDAPPGQAIGVKSVCHRKITFNILRGQSVKRQSP